MEYKNQSLAKYLNDLSAKLPAPGGGSAAALNAAMAAGLISMVINFTLGKPKYAQYQDELKLILEKSEKLRHEFLNLVDLDVAAYSSKNMRDALNVPLMVARLSCEGAKLVLPLVKKGNVNLISDVAVASILFESAFASAKFNVDINLKSIADKNLSVSFKKELTRNENFIKKVRAKTEERVGAIIRG